MKRYKMCNFVDLKVGEFFQVGKKKAKWLKDDEGGAILVVRGNAKDKVGHVSYLYDFDLVVPVDVLVF